MADKKISQLDEASSTDGTEVLPIVQSATTKKLTVAKIKDYLLGVANVFTQPQTFQPSIDGQAGTFRRNSGSQTSKVLEIQTEANASLASFDKDGVLSAPSAIFVGANGQSTAIKQLSELTTIADAAYTDTTIQIPAKAIVLGVTAKVTVEITDTTDFDLGIDGATTKFGTEVGSAANTTHVGAITPELNATAKSIRITPNDAPSDDAGRVRVTVHYLELAAPT